MITRRRLSFTRRLPRLADPTTTRRTNAMRLEKRPEQKRCRALIDRSAFAIDLKAGEKRDAAESDNLSKIGNRGRLHRDGPRGSVSQNKKKRKWKIPCARAHRHDREKLEISRKLRVTFRRSTERARDVLSGTFLTSPVRYLSWKFDHAFYKHPARVGVR